MALQSVGILFLACILYGICKAVYRLFFHPFAKYPGPRLAAITNWYGTIFAWRGDLHSNNCKWHAKYGDVIRTGPNTLCFATHTALKSIGALNANMQKAEGYTSFSASRKTPNTINAIDKKVHRFKRNIMSQVFSDQGLKTVEERFLTNVRDFIKLLAVNDNIEPEHKDGWGSTKDMNAMCLYLAFDIISDLCYGNDFDMLNSPDQRWFLSAMKVISKRNSVCMTQPKVFNWKLDQMFLAPQYKTILASGTWVKKATDARLQLGNDIKQKDAFYTMMNASDPETGMSFTPKDLWLESWLLLFAGSDTTSTTMSATFFYLAHHPDMLARVIKEVRSKFNSEEEICTGETLSSCTFLIACINEALRLAPSVPSMLPREIKEGGAMIDGNYIPKGFVVGVTCYSIHRSPKYFDAPTEFRPSRWIVDPATGVTEESVKLAKQAFVPFGMGPRSCVGFKLAWAELLVTLGRTLWKYDMRLAPESSCCHGQRQDCDYEITGWMTAIAEGPFIQFRPSQKV
ncbi:cytochrome P450 monooxygenase [Penicillium herquei]|nr:cytochrome P450 monooxygenase [Penicillium herquei]